MRRRINTPYYCGWAGDDDKVNRVWTPLVNVLETDEAFEIQAELPGVSKEDIAISLDENVLTLSGERKTAHGTDKRRYTLLEQAAGKFTRSFRLPNLIERDNISASSDNGVLTIEVPKSNAAKPRDILIN